METPDANVADAWSFMELTNEHLAPHGLYARGLYNHSPSFVWDVSFFIESTELAGKGGSSSLNNTTLQSIDNVIASSLTQPFDYTSYHLNYVYVHPPILSLIYSSHIFF